MTNFQKVLFLITCLFSTTAIFVLLDYNVYPHFQRQILGNTDPPYSVDTVFQLRYLKSLTSSLQFQNNNSQRNEQLPPGYILRQTIFKKDGTDVFGPKRTSKKRSHGQFQLPTFWNSSSISVPPNPYLLPSRWSAEGKHIYRQDKERHRRGIGRLTKFIAFYNKPSWIDQHIAFDECQTSDCRMVGTLATHKSHAVVFSAPDLHQHHHPPPRPTGQRWVYFNLESPVNTNNWTSSDIWTDQFNLTMTYRTDSDIFLPYAYLKEREDWPSKDYEAIARGKTRLAAIFVSNCHQSGSSHHRLKYVQDLQNHIQVDIYGKCGPYKCYSRHYEDCLDVIDGHYKFYLSFENSLCGDYVTEKLTKIFRNVNAIPVVRGGADYDKILPPGTYINADWFSSPRELALHLKRLDKDMSGYAELLRRKDRFVEVDPLPVLRAFCDLCHRLHSDEDGDVQYYTDVGKWFGQGACQGPGHY